MIKDRFLNASHQPGGSDTAELRRDYGGTAPVPSGLLIQYGCTCNTNIAKLTQIQNYIIRTTAHIEYPILKCGVLETKKNDEKRRKPTSSRGKKKSGRKNIDEWNYAPQRVFKTEITKHYAN